MSDPPTYRRHVWDHWGLVAGRCDALGLGDVRAHATPHHPARRDLTGGEAGKAMVRHGVGCINRALALVPRFFQNQPPARRMSPRGAPAHLNAAALGRALEILSASGGTALSRRIAGTAAQRLGLRPPSTHRDRRRLPGDGRDNSAEAPEAPVVPSTRGDRREQRPDRHHVRWALLVAHPAGLPRLLTPRSGHSREAPAWAQVIRAHREPLHTTDGAPSLVADRALASEAPREKLAHPAGKWRTRVPATLPAAPTALLQAKPRPRAPSMEGERSRAWTSRAGGVAPRWGLTSSDARQPQAPRPGGKPLRTQRAPAVHAWKP